MTELECLLAKLISFPSITPSDAGCQVFMRQFLTDLGFDCLILDNPPVSNFFARIGQNSPLLVFAGHTDVVPCGDESKWHTPPFTLTEKNGLLYGRGTADMKGSLAAMLQATTQFLKDYPHFSGSLGFLITSGEEGDDFDLGTAHVMQELLKRDIKIDYCIVGEPSSTKKLGDMIKIGRRGSLTGRLILEGKQGHVAYPHLAENPIHTISPVLAELCATEWDQGNAHFPPTSFQITQIQSGGQAGNIIPGELNLQFNFRYSTENTVTALQEKVNQCFHKHHLTPLIKWRLNGEPFLTAKGHLLTAAIEAIHEVTQLKPELSTSGGTSDARFIAPYGIEVIELGPVNASIHQINEWISLDELEKLSAIYSSVCRLLLC